MADAHSAGGAAGPRPPFEPLAAGDPAVIGGYRLHARLGAGGMGRVYLAFTPGGRALAVKVVRREFAEDPEFRGRFAQEIRAAQRVNGVYTAQVVDAGPDAEQPWLATAYVPGPSLAAAVRQFGPLPVRTVLLLTGAVAESLAAIHAAAVVHRDLKPANVVLAEDGPRVIDFGIARAADSTPLTATGIRIGTPQYMAPEQALGNAAGPATDLFSLGSLAFYAATGRTPFGDGQEMAVLYRVVNEQPDLSGCPPELLDVVRACLVKDPAERVTGPALIGLCRERAGGDLRITAGWLPSAVADEATRRTVAAPAGPTYVPVEAASSPAGAGGAGAGAAEATTLQVAPNVGNVGEAGVPGAGAAGVAAAAGAGAAGAAPVAGTAPAGTGAEAAPAGAGAAPMGAWAAPAGAAGQMPAAGAWAATPAPAPTPSAYPPGAMPIGAALQGQGGPGSVPGGKAPNWGRRLLLGALVVVLLVGGGAIAAVSLDGKNSNTTGNQADNQSQNHDQGQNQVPSESPSTDGGQPSSDASPNGTANVPTASANPTDTTVVDNGAPPGTLLGSYHIDLPQGYGFNLTSDLNTPNTAVVNESGVNLDVDFPGDFGYFEASTPNATMAILQSGTAGSYQNCLDDTQYAGQMNLSDLSVGTEICAISPRGRVALLKITHLPQDGDASTYIGFDITLWQGVITDD